MQQSKVKRANQRQAGGFTLIELVTVIVILGVLSVVAIPVYLDYSVDAKFSACRGALGAMRTAIANYHAYSLTEAGGGGAATFPAVSDLTTRGVVLADVVPPNPFDTDGTPNNVVDASGQPRGTIVGTDMGWAYDPTTGQIWANSNSAGKFTGENTL